MKEVKNATERYFGEVDAWLVVARRGLCKEAQQRVSEEVTDHFEQAIEESVGKGISPEEAETQALISLGCPRQANREYRRSCLTRWQKSNIDQFVLLRKSWLLLALLISICIFRSWLDFMRTGNPIIGLSAHWFLWLEIWAAYALFRLAPLKIVVMVAYAFYLVPFNLLIGTLLIVAMNLISNPSPRLSPTQLAISALLLIAANAVFIWRVTWPIIAKIRWHPKLITG